MKRLISGSLLAPVICFFAFSGLATNAYAQASSDSAHMSAGAGHHGVFTVELLKPLDSKKLKQGDPVEAKLTGGITLPSGAQVPAGTRIVGHVTQASARSKSESDSSLGFVFDKISRPGGEDTPVTGTLKAVAPNPNSDVTTGNNGVDYGNTLRSAMAPAGAAGGDHSAAPLLNEDSTGVLGFKNMKLADGVLTTPAKELKLDAGTRLLLNVTMH